MGSSGSALSGLIVHVGITDDYTGHIWAVISTPHPPVTIPEELELLNLYHF